MLNSPGRQPMEFELGLAGPADDPAIRRLLRANPVPGAIAMTFEREPDYFRGCGPMGRFCQVMLARHLPSGEVAGVACRAARPLFINGVEETVGYIGELRVDPRYRGRWLVARGARLLRELHADGRVEGYLATITEGNREALGLLLDRRRGNLPVLREVDRLVTLAMVVRPGRGPADPSVLARATEADLPEVVAFLGEHGPRRQFFPAYTEADFASGTTLGFRIDDLLLYRSRGRIAGCLGLWDQSAYKQSVVQGYSGALRWGRPFYNVFSRIAGLQPLPAPGQPVRIAYASFCCVADDDPEVFAALLAGLRNLAAARGFAYLTMGLFERDPLLDVARRFTHIPYHSRLYTVSWEDGGSFHARLDDRPGYLDIATL